MTRYMTRVQQFWCDAPGCHVGDGGEGDAKGVWAMLRRDGWRQRDGKHYCPACPRPKPAYSEEGANV